MHSSDVIVEKTGSSSLDGESVIFKFKFGLSYPSPTRITGIVNYPDQLSAER